jgi:hypothetical protein
MEGKEIIHSHVLCATRWGTNPTNVERKKNKAVTMKGEEKDEVKVKLSPCLTN